jgi:hypothetical protein
MAGDKMDTERKTSKRTVKLERGFSRGMDIICDGRIYKTAAGRRSKTACPVREVKTNIPPIDVYCDGKTVTNLPTVFERLAAIKRCKKRESK